MIETVKKDNYVEFIRLPVPLAVKLNVPFKVERKNDNFVRVKLLSGDIDKFSGTLYYVTLGNICEDEYMYGKRIASESSRTKIDDVILSNGAYDEYIVDLFGELNAVPNNATNRKQQCRQIIRSYTSGSDFARYVDNSDINWPKLFSYTTECPITYWIDCPSYEIEDEDGSATKVHAKEDHPDYVICELNDGTVYFTTPAVTKYTEISDNSDEALAVFSKIDEFLHETVLKSSTLIVQALNKLVEQFDYQKYLEEIRDRYGDDEINVAGEYDNVEEVEELVKEEDNVDFDKTMEKIMSICSAAGVKDDDDGIYNPGDEAVVTSPDNSHHNLKAAPKEEKEDAEEFHIPSIGSRNMAIVTDPFAFGKEISAANIHNYTGHTIIFASNIVMKNRYAQLVGDPIVVLELEPEGRLTVAESIVQLGSFNGVPIEEVLPARISAVPDVPDGDIILVSSIYYKHAIRMGFDTSKMFIATDRVERKTLDGPEYYYRAITKKI